MKRRTPFPLEPSFSHERGCKIALHFLGGLLLCLSITRVAFALPQKARANDAQADSCPIAGTLGVATSQGQVSRFLRAITPENYALELPGELQVGPYRCLFARTIPKRTDKHLFEEMVWIGTQDYAVVRITGHPAKNVSFWIERVNFVREYQKIDGFWLPLKDEATVEVRMNGQKVLNIGHQDYSVTGIRNTEEPVQNSEN